MIRPKISLFGVGRLGHSGGEKEKERREEEENTGLELLNLLVWNSCLELLFGTYVWICWLENYPNSFFVYVWVRKTLTLQCMCILVGSSQLCGWF